MVCLVLQKKSIKISYSPFRQYWLCYHVLCKIPIYHENNAFFKNFVLAFGLECETLMHFNIPSEWQKPSWVNDIMSNRWDNNIYRKHNLSLSFLSWLGPLHILYCPKMKILAGFWNIISAPFFGKCRPWLKLIRIDCS